MDLVLFFIFIYLLLNGLYRGFLGFIAKLLGFVVGLYLSIPFYKTLSGYLSKIFSGSFFFLDFLSFFLIFLFIVSTFTIFERVLKGKLYKRKMVVLTDRLLGAFVGVLSFLLIVFLLIKMQESNPLAKKLISQSKIVSMIKKSI